MLLKSELFAVNDTVNLIISLTLSVCNYIEIMCIRGMDTKALSHFSERIILFQYNFCWMPSCLESILE